MGQSLSQKLCPPQTVQPPQAVLTAVVTGLIGVIRLGGRIGGVLGADLVQPCMTGVARGMTGVLGAAMPRGHPTGAAMHPLTLGGVFGTAMARCMPRAAMARGMPRAAMARGDWMPKSNRSRGLAWLMSQS